MDLVTGAIQVPGSGKPIVLLADHQTTGGYPKIATVISADLPAAGRLKPGASVRFDAVSVEEAEALARETEAAIQRSMRDLVPVADDSALLRDNLISGVVDATD